MESYLHLQELFVTIVIELELHLLVLLRNCLFDDGVFNLRDFMRKGASNEDLKELFLSLVKAKPENGFIAEANRKNGAASESMSTIGG